MPGVLDILKAAVMPAAAARGGYLEGRQVRENRDYERQQADEARSLAAEQRDATMRRQDALDKIKAAMDQSTITRDAAATRASDALAKLRATPKPEKPPAVTHINQYDDATKTISDIDATGKRINTRKATALEIAKNSHISRDPNEPAPPAKLNDATREKFAQDLADRAVSAVGGDPVKAQTWMNSPGEYPKAVSAGLTRSHYYDAARRFQRQAAIDRDTHGIGAKPVPSPTKPTAAPRPEPTKPDSTVTDPVARWKAANPQLPGETPEAYYAARRFQRQAVIDRDTHGIGAKPVPSPTKPTGAPRPEPTKPDSTVTNPVARWKAANPKQPGETAEAYYARYQAAHTGGGE